MTVMLLSLALLASAPDDQLEKAKEDRLVCKVDHATGSRLGAKKICKTRAGWAQYYRDLDPSNRMIDNLGMRGSGVGPSDVRLPR